MFGKRVIHKMSQDILYKFPTRCPDCGSHRIDRISVTESQCQRCETIFTIKVTDDIKAGKK